MPIMKIIKRSLSFSVIPKTQEQQQICVSHASQLVSYKMEILPGGIRTRKPDKFYGSRASMQGDKCYNFHINTFDRFMERVKYASKNNGWQYEVQDLPAYVPTKVGLQFNKDFILRDYQEDIVKFALKRLNENADYKNMLLGIPTGQGKTSVALFVAAQLGYLTCIIIKPSYIDKWIDDCKKLLGLKDKDFKIVKGGSSMRKLTKMAVKGKYRTPITIISNKTYQHYITDFEQDPVGFADSGYKCTPFELMEKLKVGLLLRDEIHQDFHFNFKIDTYTHVHSAMALSATLVSRDNFLCDMYDVMFPKECRYEGGAYQKYVDLYPYFYNITNMKGIRTSFSGPNGFYSHNAFEMSIMRDANKFRNYLVMIDKCLRESYFKNPREKKKALIYCSTIELCTFVTKYLSQLYPKLDIRRYTGDDPYENMLVPDIRIGTVGGASTAFDIPDLVTVIMTQALDSIQSNIQAFGRLRRLDGETKHEFYYFVCKDIDRHMEYHKSKMTLFKDRTKSIQPLHSGVWI